MKTTIKEKVQQLMESHKSEVNILRAKIEAWENDTWYSENRKNEKIEELRGEIEQLDKMFNGVLKKIILDEKKAFIGDPKTKPADYQIQISNALKFLEMAGKNLTNDRAFEILKPFQDDFETMMLFKPIVSDMTSGDKLWDALNKQLGEANIYDNYETIINNFKDIELSANNFFNSSGIRGLHERLTSYIVLDKISEIDQLLNSFNAA
jgi:hypothetical protein